MSQTTTGSITPRDAAYEAFQSASLLRDQTFLTELRESMMAFAILQLGDRTQAEDAVQEAFSGALAGVERFQRRSAVKTWVFSILKHKIADTLRRKSREVQADSVNDQAGLNETFDHLFDSADHWHGDTMPRRWRSPAEACSDRQFWQVFDACLNNLPAQHARLFMMREMLDLTTEEIMSAAGINQSNLNVSLYRARLRLRECLDVRWFQNPDRGLTP